MTFCQKIKNVSLDCLQTKNSSTSPKTVFYCCGFVVSKISDFSYTPSFNLRHGMPEDNICSFIDVENAQEAFDNDYSESNIKIPFFGTIPEGLFIGRTIQIKGKIIENAERYKKLRSICRLWSCTYLEPRQAKELGVRPLNPLYFIQLKFSINLVTDETKDCDIAFHFNPRFDRRVVVRNTKRRGSWGVEEIACNRQFPFLVGRNFSITVFVADGQFMVSVNKNHFCSYNWKIPLKNILNLQIDGDITLSQIVYLTSTKYPSLPKCRLPRVLLPNHNKFVKVRKNKDGIVVGTEVVISGQVKLLPHSFYINLQVGSTIVPHPIIPLHLNLRLCRPGLAEQQVICNSWVNGGWESEIKPPQCPFLPGMEFILKIYYQEDGFVIFERDTFLVGMPLRLPYPPVIDTVLVEGDVNIHTVKIRSMSK